MPSETVEWRCLRPSVVSFGALLDAARWETWRSLRFKSLLTMLQSNESSMFLKHTTVATCKKALFISQLALQLS